jgi:hypothetical protein
MAYQKPSYTQKDGKILYHLRKPKAKNEIIFVEDIGMDEDGWFISVRHQNLKTKAIQREHCIILKNVDSWLSGYLHEGYVNITESLLP